MNYSVKKASLLLLVFLGIIFFPIGQSLATNVDFTDSESGHCYGCEDSIEQVREIIVILKIVCRIVVSVHVQLPSILAHPF